MNITPTEIQDLLAGSTGAAIIHIFHLTVNAGGIKGVWNKIINGNAPKQTTQTNNEKTT